MRRNLARWILTAFLSAGLGQAAPPGGVTNNTTQLFTLDKLEEGRGQVIASTEYQVALLFPVDVQSVAVTINKQAALIPTVAGNIVYLDVAQAGGNATLNVVLTGKTLLQFDVALTTRRDGVTRYRIVNPDELSSNQTPVQTTTPPAPVMDVTMPTSPRPPLDPAVIKDPASFPPQTFSAEGVKASFTVTRVGQEATIDYAVIYDGQDTVFGKQSDLTVRGPGGTSLPIQAQQAPEASLLLARVPLTGRIRVSVPEGATNLNLSWDFKTLLQTKPITLTATLAVTR